MHFTSIAYKRTDYTNGRGSKLTIEFRLRFADALYNGWNLGLASGSRPLRPRPAARARARLVNKSSARSAFHRSAILASLSLSQGTKRLRVLPSPSQPFLQIQTQKINTHRTFASLRAWARCSSRFVVGNRRLKIKKA